MSEPKTTPECKRLQDMVIAGLKAGLLDTQAHEDARVALKRLRKKRCTKSLEYIMQVSSRSGLLDTFAQEIRNMARRYLDELS